MEEEEEVDEERGGGSPGLAVDPCKISSSFCFLISSKLSATAKHKMQEED